MNVYFINETNNVFHHQATHFMIYLNGPIYLTHNLVCTFWLLNTRFWMHYMLLELLFNKKLVFIIATRSTKVKHYF